MPKPPGMADNIEVHLKESVDITPEMRAFWDSFKGLLAVARHRLGKEMMISIALSAVTREIRRDLGPAGAANVLNQFARQQERIKDYDVG